MTTKQIRKLATVAATAALALQLFAGTSLAARPNASSTGTSYDFAGTGWAGFTSTYTFADNNIPRLYLQLEVKGASSIGYVNFERNDKSIAGCSKSGLIVKCLFNSNVRTGDTFKIEVAAVPSANDVTAVAEWSTTGFVPGGNNSHGDAWDICAAGDNDCRVATAAKEFGYAPGTVYLVASRLPDSSGNFVQGFGQQTLATNQVVDKKTNPQAARLEGLPSGVLASVDDQVTLDANGFWTLRLHVDNGADHNFQLIIVYPKGTSAPTAYQHFDDQGNLIATYTACAKGDSTECFTWNSKTYTTTLNLPHNGGVRRA